jgi:beta-xylosidase
LIHREEKSHLIATGGLYAPTIRYHNGTFYIVCTNVVHQSLDGSNNELQNFIVSTTDIHNSKWSEPVYFDFYGIDPSLFFDTDGKAYLCGSKSPGPETKIMLFEIDVNTGRKLTEEKELWHGTGGIYPEGPHIYLRNSFYYLMVAEGGTHEGHTVTMARSKDIWGPYEPSPLNPILSAAGTDEYVQATGHCEAFEDKNGDWWGVCLGIRQGKEDLWGLGRETFLTRGKWNEDGWLKFNRAKIHLDGFEAVKADERLTAATGTDLLYIHDPDLSRYTFEERAIALRTTTHDLSSPEASPTFIGKRQRRLEGMSTATYVLRSQKTLAGSLQASLVVYKDEHRWLRIMYASSDRTVSLQVFNKAKDIDRATTQKLNNMIGRLQFILRYTEMEYTAYYALNRGKQVLLGKVDTMDLSDKDFTGPIIGLHALGDSRLENGLYVPFEDFVVDSA